LVCRLNGVAGGSEEFPADFEPELRQSICLLALCGWLPAVGSATVADLGDGPLRLRCETCHHQALLHTHSILRWPPGAAVASSELTCTNPFVASPDGARQSPSPPPAPPPPLHPLVRRQLTPEQAAAVALGGGRRFGGALSGSPGLQLNPLFGRDAGPPAITSPLTSPSSTTLQSPPAKRQRLAPHSLDLSEHRPFCPFNGGTLVLACSGCCLFCCCVCVDFARYGVVGLILTRRGLRADGACAGHPRHDIRPRQQQHRVAHRLFGTVLFAPTMMIE
jgi:hypothetical protein